MLQKSPMYSYFPAQDVARARRFYEGRLGLKAKQEIAGGVVYEFGKGTAALGSSSIYTGGGAKAAGFKDSEGNILAVIQSL